MSASRKRCFVVMPFSQTSKEHTEEYWTNHYESFLKPLIEQCEELEAYRSEPLHGDIIRQIISALVVSPVVVANLTDRNPNVYWELGVRQSFKHSTVTIAEEGTEIPFDISVKSVLFYHPKDYIKNAIFEKQFKKTVKDCLLHPDSPDSHVLETISGRGTLFEIIHRDEAARRVSALISECERNIEVINHIGEVAEKNQKNPKKRSYATRRLRSVAVELLITTRYLDEEDSFYRLTERFFNNVIDANEVLSTWKLMPEGTEKWLLGQRRRQLDVFEKLKEELTRIHQELSAS